jgi:hypothetical protein
MSEAAKNIYKLSDKEKEILNDIITVCVAKIYHFVMSYNENPKQYVREILNLSKTDKALSVAYFIFNAKNISSDQIFSHKGLNKKLAKEILYDENEATYAILSSAEESKTYLKSYDMSEVLQELVDEGLFLNIRGKKKIRNLAPQVLPKQNKGAEYKDSKPEGYYSYYRITDDLETLKRVISNPEATAFIYNNLKKYGILQKYFEFMVLAFIYTLIESDDERFYQFATIAIQANIDNKRIHPSEWRKIKQYIVSLKEEELQDLAKQMVAYQLDNPVDHNYLLLSLFKS